MPTSADHRRVLTVHQLTAGYTSVPILHGVSLDASSAELVVIIGPNGSGKSTLLKAIMRLIRVDAGRVTLDGEDLSGLPPYLIARGGIGYVPQSRSVFPSLSVAENLETAGLSMARRDRVTRMQAVLAAFPDLRDATQKRGGALSGGQRNLLGVARAMMLNPKVLLVDEPTAGLSPANARSVWTQLERVAAGDTAVVVVEQSVSGALEHAHRCFVLVNGRNRLNGTAAEVRDLDLASVFLGGSAVAAPSEQLSR